IARVLREVGLVREMGEGIRRIFDVMRSNALAEPGLESDETSFRVTLYSKSMYDANVELWLSNFEGFGLSEQQRAVVALGYGGQQFSTQDVIDRLGIVDIDELRKVLSPLRAQGLVERTVSHKVALFQARKAKIPKREIPSYRIDESAVS